MFDQKQSPQEHFRLILLTVMGQVFNAADYSLEESPVQWAGGRFRFFKVLDNDLIAFIEYQVLAYIDSEWSSGAPSRFKVTLTRTDQNSPSTFSKHSGFAQRDLSALVVEDFSVAILPSADHWWTYSSTDELGKALAEAGHLIAGYGMPWLTGELKPGNTNR